MQGVNVVCIVQRKNLPALHAMCKKWVEPVSAAHVARHEKIEAYIAERVRAEKSSGRVLGMFR